MAPRCRALGPDGFAVHPQVSASQTVDHKRQFTLCQSRSNGAIESSTILTLQPCCRRSPVSRAQRPRRPAAPRWTGRVTVALRRCLGDSPLEGSRHAAWAVAGGSIPTVDVNRLGDSCGVTRPWGGPWWGRALPHPARAEVQCPPRRVVLMPSSHGGGVRSGRGRGAGMLSRLGVGGPRVE